MDKTETHFTVECKCGAVLDYEVISARLGFRREVIKVSFCKKCAKKEYEDGYADAYEYYKDDEL